MSEQAYDSEDLLQRLLAEYPNLLAGDQIDRDSPRRWLLISREASVPSCESGPGRWSVDHLFLDQDAVPTLVEVKRSTDTRIRREVIGQMLDYAANAVTYWPVDEVRLKFEIRCENDGIEPEEIMEEFLAEDMSAEHFWEKLKINLKAGKIRMLFVADELPTELQRIIEFLNEQMDPAEVLGVEVKQYTGENLRTLVPRVVGQTVEAQEKKTGGRMSGRQWDEVSFLQEMKEKIGVQEAEISAKFLEWGRSEMMIPRWGKGKKTASCNLILTHGNREHIIFGINTEGNGKLWLQFGAYMKHPPFDSKERRAEFLRRLNSISGISIPEDVLTADRYPNIPLSFFEDASMYDQIISEFKWFVEQIRNG